jgi:tRNA dimethylallyltransferase
VDRKTPLIVITGPTGSGKTRLALDLSRSWPIEVISADSMQIYRYMDIATAKPGKLEKSLLRHHLIDIVDPDKEFNAGMFAALARENISQVLSRGNLPVVVGGTGLYIKSLIYGLIPAPPRSQKLRAYFRSLREMKGTPYLWHILARTDPASAAKITPNDFVRIVRYLEIIFSAGVRPSSLHEEHAFSTPQYDARVVCIMPDRSMLYHAINERVHTMMDLGLVAETKKLLAMGYDSSLRSMQTLAYKHVLRYLNSEIRLKDAVSQIQRDTRRYAKRQITWIRSNHDPGTYCEADDAEQLISCWIEELFIIKKNPENSLLG